MEKQNNDVANNNQVNDNVPNNNQVNTNQANNGNDIGIFDDIQVNNGNDIATQLQMEQLNEINEKDKKLADLARQNEELEKKLAEMSRKDLQKKLDGRCLRSNRLNRTSKSSTDDSNSEDALNNQPDIININWNVSTFHALLKQFKDTSIKKVNLENASQKLEEFYVDVIKENYTDKKVFSWYLVGFCKWLLRKNSKSKTKAYRYISLLPDVKKHNKLADTKVIQAFISVWKFYLSSKFPIHFKKRNSVTFTDSNYNPCILHFQKNYRSSFNKSCKKYTSLQRKWVKVWNAQIKILDNETPPPKSPTLTTKKKKI